MKTKLDRRMVILLLGIIILTLILWGILVQWQRVINIVQYIFFSMVIAYILTPISRWLERFVSRPKAVIILFISISIISATLLVLFIPLIIRQAAALINRLPAFVRQIQDLILKLQREMERIGIPYSVQITLTEYFDQLDQWFASYLKGRMDGAVDGIGRFTAIFTIPVLSFYFLKDREYFRGVILELIPSKVRKPVLQTATEISKILDRFIRGQMLIALIVGVLAFIGYLIIRLPYAAIMGLFAGIFEIVPYLGPVLGAIPATMIAVLHSPSKLVATIVVVIVVQQLESNIFTPKIMGSHVGLHPVYIIIALWVAGTFLGIIGMFFAVPAVLILRVIIKNIYFSIVSNSY
ncbi:MAG: AI-2E family transporter [Clostridiales bacterium]|nr:AI-2E family transporter [Clostridiales bacterium]